MSSSCIKDKSYYCSSMDKSVWPVVSPWPVKTLHLRIEWKFKHLCKVLFKQMKKNKFRLRVINANYSIYEMKNRSSKQASSVFMIKDRGMFPNFLKSASWETEECKVASELVIRSKSNLVIDLGANHGLWSLGVLSILREQTHTLHKLITVEPDRAMCACIHINLLPVLSVKTFHQNFNFALLGAGASEIELNSSKLQEVVLNRDSQNIGHTTLDVDLVPTNRTVNLNSHGEIAKKFFLTADFISSNNSIFLKSDLQGHDAPILSAICNEVWRNIVGFQIEIWPIGKHQFEIDGLMITWSDEYDLFFLENGQRNPIDLMSLSAYWKSNTLIDSTFGDYRTLFGIRKSKP